MSHHLFGVDWTIAGVLKKHPPKAGLLSDSTFFFEIWVWILSFCMGAAWRDLAGRKSNFNKILGYVTEIR
jgi:hypothetical protein